MNDKAIFILSHAEARRRAVANVQAAPDGYKVTIQPPPRTLDQNAAQWPILEAFAQQLMWPVNGEMVYLLAAEWKDILTAAFQRETRMAAGLNGGFVMLGVSTSQMTKRAFSEYLDFLKATAAARGVELREDVAA
jgi:hypothetical protein